MAKHKSLNILYVGTLPPHPGGTAISSSLLLEGFTKLGHTVRALAPITAQALRSGDSFAVSHTEIDVRRYLVPYFQTANWAEIPAEYRKLEGEQIHQMLRGMVNEDRPDIIFIGRESFAWHVPDLAKFYSLPCILVIRGTTPVRILNQAIPEAVVPALLEQYGKVDLMVVVAKHLVEPFHRLGFNNIKVILNAVDLHQFSPRPKVEALLRKLALQEDDIIVVHASNLTTLKRPLDIVSSAEVTLQQNAKLVYVIVGDGACRAAMEEACRSKNISEKFRFVGWVDYSCVPDYLNLADIVVMPSEEEVQARVYLETQACARLLLASDIPAAREVITDGETGLLFRKGDIDDLTAKTLLAASDPKLRAEIGRKAREQVKTHDLNHAVAAYVTILEEVLERLRG